MFNVGDKVVYIGDDYTFPEVAHSNVSGMVVGITGFDTAIMYNVHFTEVQQTLLCYVEELQLEQPTEE